MGFLALLFSRLGTLGGTRAVRGALPVVGGAGLGLSLPSLFGGGGSPKRRRRRRKRLTQSDFMELAQISSVIGKTAAANALPFYLGRGVG